MSVLQYVSEFCSVGIYLALILLIISIILDFLPSPDTMNDGRFHVGIQNAHDRLKQMVDGELTLEGVPGKGGNCQDHFLYSSGYR